MIQFKENIRTDGQTLFYKTLPATAGGPKGIFVGMKST